jgi:hypothetical protein
MKAYIFCNPFSSYVYDDAYDHADVHISIDESRGISPYPPNPNNPPYILNNPLNRLNPPNP